MVRTRRVAYHDIEAFASIFTADGTVIAPGYTAGAGPPAGAEHTIGVTD